MTFLLCLVYKEIHPKAGRVVLFSSVIDGAEDLLSLYAQYDIENPAQQRTPSHMLSFFIKSRSKQERLWHACSYGRETTVKELIEAGANPNWRSHEFECFPIHVASQGKPSVLKMLLQANCHIDSLDKDGNTAVHHAAMAGHLENVSMLLAAGAIVDPCNNNDWTPLFNTVYWNHPSVTKLLLSKGANPFKLNKEGRNVLHELCRSKSRNEDGLEEILHMLLDSMESYRATSEINGHGLTNGETAPSHAPLVSAGDSINAKAVCQNGLDFEANFTPLLFACYHGHLKLVSSLLSRGADIKAADKNGWTALHWAAQRCHADVVEMLLDRGASRSAEDLRGDMPCDVTVDDGLRECLLPDMAYPNIVSNGHVTTDDEEEDEAPGTCTPTGHRLAGRVAFKPPGGNSVKGLGQAPPVTNLDAELTELCILENEIQRIQLAVMERLPGDTPFRST